MRVEKILVSGTAEGELLVLDEPISFWGGIDTASGRIVDDIHPQNGLSVDNRLIYLPHTRGSSGTSSALTELMRSNLGPAGIVLGSTDSMITVGALVGERLYGVSCPVVVAKMPSKAQGIWRIDGDTLERSDA